MESRARFESLFHAHAGAVRAYALRRSDASTADEVVADVFLIAWRRLADVPAEPRPWLLGVARRVLANRRRGRTRSEALVQRLGALTSGEPSTADLAGELGGDLGVAEALGALRERDREVLLLIAWDGLTPAEAAHALGMARGAFAVALHRARRRFARLLAQQSSEPDQSAALEVTT